MSNRSPSTIYLGSGIGELEDRLFEEIRDFFQSRAGLNAATGKSSLPSAWLVVPTTMLRERLIHQILHKYKPGVLGLQVLTSSAAAREILRIYGKRWPQHPEYLDVFVQRLAPEFPLLRRWLEKLEDGFGFATSTVALLQRAGWKGKHETEIRKVLDSIRPPQRAQRTKELLQLASAVVDKMNRYSLGDFHTRLVDAAEAINSKAAHLFPNRVWCYGFGNEPEAERLFLTALAQHLNARLFLLDMSEEEESGEVVQEEPRRPTCSHSLGVYATTLAAAPVNFHPPKLQAFSAPGVRAESKELAYRIRALLDQGVEAESIGIVTRDLQPYAVELSRCLEDLGIPHASPHRIRGLQPWENEWISTLDLLKHQANSSLDTWLNAHQGFASGLKEDLRLALRTLGLTHLGEFVQINIEEALGDQTALPLPLRSGLRESSPGDAPESDESDAGIVAARRFLSRVSLERALEAASNFLSFCDGWTQQQSVAAHLREIRGILKTDLGWKSLPPLEHVSDMQEELPVLVSCAEFVRLLHLRTQEGVTTLGGAGAGVPVLNLDQAQALSFTHLFVIGLNRDLFPQVPAEDSLLPDSIRRHIRHVLPGLPLRQWSYIDQRQAFYTLLKASPNVTLSWQVSDATGRGMSPSPFVDEVRLDGSLQEVYEVPRSQKLQLQDWNSRSDRLLNLHESLRLTALCGSRSHFGKLLRLAFDHSQAQAHFAVLEEMDPDLRTAHGRKRTRKLSPWHGMIGPLQPQDPRSNSLYVTTLEQYARCPWRSLLARILRLESLPDPTTELPTLDPLLLGNIIHQALEELLFRDSPQTLVRPHANQVRSVLESVTVRLADQSGIRLQILQNAMIAKALPFVLSALQEDWPSESAEVHVQGTEQEHSFKVRFRQKEQELYFRVDRTDVIGGTTWRHTDYKTGKIPLTAHKRIETRRRHIRQGILSGQHLQAAVYAANASDGKSVRGRYLYLHPDMEPGNRQIELEAEDSLVSTDLPQVLDRLLEAWHQGVFFPRLEDAAGKEPGLCSFCEFHSCCVRGDSGARRRLHEFAAPPHSAENKSKRSDRAALQLWWIGNTPSSDSQEQSS